MASPNGNRLKTGQSCPGQLGGYHRAPENGFNPYMANRKELSDIKTQIGIRLLAVAVPSGMWTEMGRKQPFFLGATGYQATGFFVSREYMAKNQDRETQALENRVIRNLQAAACGTPIPTSNGTPLGTQDFNRWLDYVGVLDKHQIVALLRNIAAVQECNLENVENE